MRSRELFYILSEENASPPPTKKSYRSTDGRSFAYYRNTFLYLNVLVYRDERWQQSSVAADGVFNIYKNF